MRKIIILYLIFFNYLTYASDSKIDSPFGGTNLHLPDGEALAWHVHDDALAS